jgi:hypothetical protein
MNYSDDVNTKVISLILWGNKKDPTEYDYQSKTIRIREDYLKQMTKTNPLTHHWVVHELAHHMMSVEYGKDFIINNSHRYPDNAIERFAYAYQFYYLMQNKSCSTFDELCIRDPFFRHKKIYSQALSYYWNNANFIIDEFNKTPHAL